MKSVLSLLISLSLVSAVEAGGKNISYIVDRATYEGYYTSPSDDAPFILLLHDWDGLTDYEKKRADMLAAEGYAVFAADLFGTGIRPTKDRIKRLYTDRLYENRALMRKLLIGAMDAAFKQGANMSNGVVAGYCFGGAAALELARAGAPMRGFVTFHGGLSTPEGQDYSHTKGKVLVFHGGADSLISMTDFNKLKSELEQYNVDHEMIVYEDAPHAFTVFDSDRYHESADTASWERFLTFLNETLSPP